MAEPGVAVGLGTCCTVRGAEREVRTRARCVSVAIVVVGLGFEVW